MKVMKSKKITLKPINGVVFLGVLALIGLVILFIVLKQYKMLPLVFILGLVVLCVIITLKNKPVNMVNKEEKPNIDVIEK